MIRIATINDIDSLVEFRIKLLNESGRSLYEKYGFKDVRGEMSYKFITDLSKMDIPYFDFTIEEVIEDVQNANLENESLE